MFYNGWTILIAFLLATGGIRMAERAHKTGKARGLASMMWITLACGLYMLAAGLHMIFAGPASVTSAGVDAKAWLIVFLSRMWPYALMLMGAIAVFVSGVMLMRERRHTAERT